MDKELMDLLVRLKVESKILRGLVDAILDNTYLNYSGDNLKLESCGADTVITIVKAFFGDEVDNRIKELNAKRRKEEESDNG